VDDFERHVNGASLHSAVPLGVYVHVPFCRKRCTYCYYLSYDDQSDNIQRYCDALLREARAYAAKGALQGRPVTFAYIGGGTPSLMSPSVTRRLLKGLREAFDMEEALEVTFECAPATVTAERLQALRDGGVTRVSMGVQQMDDNVLKESGRMHLVKDILRAMELLRARDFPVLNIDLMAGMLGETDTSFDRSLEQVVELDPDSVTIYLMEIPHNTALHDLLAKGELKSEPAGWEVKRARLSRAFSRLEAAGFTVRSAYAAVKSPGRHRFVYQEEQYLGADLLGLGVSAFSYLGGWHQQNLAALDPYLKAVEEGHLPLGRAHRLEQDERMVRDFILQLKLGRVALAPFHGRYGVDVARCFQKPLQDFAGRGWLTVDQDAVRVTREGLVRIDSILPAFYLPAHQGVSYA
jgi:oxygen-independent coproporphyrinogen-3 oxidase